jgi:signal recognition particle subunit SRP54
MFQSLSDLLHDSLDSLRGIGRISAQDIKKVLHQDIRSTLIESDVSPAAVDAIIQEVESAALGKKVLKSIRPGDALIKEVYHAMTHALGKKLIHLNLNANAPVVIVVAGLQGAGKTTTVAKLAYYLKHKKQKTVMVTSTDIYRPAAIEQLEALANENQLLHFPSTTKDKPTRIVKQAIDSAKKSFADVLIIDTAGRLHIDDEMMREIQAIQKTAEATETLLVADSMAGQDAAHVAKQFDDALDITGIILTKADGDARGGAALSMKSITNKPIKFMGTGEKVYALEVFHPERIASRILDMGDILTLVEQAEEQLDKEKADQVAKKIKKGKRFDFNDFLDQLKQMKKMGSMKSLLAKLPGAGKINKAAMDMMDEGLLVKMEAIIQSMTRKERKFPAVINGSRKKRLAAGSGTDIQDVNKLLKQFTQMQKMLKRFKGKNMSGSLKALEGQLPPGALQQLQELEK